MERTLSLENWWVLHIQILSIDHDIMKLHHLADHKAIVSESLPPSKRPSELLG